MAKYLPESLMHLDPNNKKVIDEAVEAMKVEEMRNDGVTSDINFDYESYKLLLKCALKRDLSEWNESREDKNFPHVNLSGAVLSFEYLGLFLQGADLRGANLTGADLRGADLCGADLRGADLQGAIIKGAYLRNANFRGANLTGVDLQGFIIGGTVIGGTVIGGADLWKADFRDVKMSPDQREYAISQGAIVDDVIEEVEKETKNKRLENLVADLREELSKQEKTYISKFEKFSAEQKQSIDEAVKQQLANEKTERRKNENKLFEAQKDFLENKIQEDLGTRKYKLQWLVLLCFVLSFLMLAGAVTWIIIDYGCCKYALLQTTEIIVRSTRLVAGVLILAALAKFFYSLGKSYMHEAIKCSDRRHAISLGQFFLKAFETPVTYEECKDIFSEWNMENQSAFHSLKTGDIDPRIIEMISAIGSVLNTQDKSNKSKD